MDMPLFVTPISPEKPLVTTTLSFFWAVVGRCNIKTEISKVTILAE
jgi:hypothetical protein